MDVLGVVGVLAELPRERTQLLSNLGRLRQAAGPITPSSETRSPTTWASGAARCTR